MTAPGDLANENRALHERLSRLGEASLRINASLELETVLQGVLESARSLTGARFGVITVIDGSGEVENVLASGLTPEQSRQLWETPDSLRFSEYLSNLPGALRVRDFADHARAAGLPDFRPPATVRLLPCCADPPPRRRRRQHLSRNAGTRPGVHAR